MVIIIAIVETLRPFPLFKNFRLSSIYS